jgi:hypothetical protein
MHLPIIINQLGTNEKKGHEHLTSDPWTDFTVDEILKVFKQIHNWKSPGLDKL